LVRPSVQIDNTGVYPSSFAMRPLTQYRRDSGYTAIGDEARVAAGSRLHGVRIYPRVKVQSDLPLSPGMVLAQHLSTVAMPPETMAPGLAAIAEATD
jgi:hypothetical protein